MALNPRTADDFLKRSFKEYLKVYLVIKYKGFSWKTELQNSFSIADSIVVDALKILEREGYIISKDFWSIDSNVQEAIKRLNGAYFHKINSYPKIYVLNEDEVKTNWYELHKEDIEKLIKDDGSMNHTITLLQQKTQNLKNLLEEFERIEQNDFDRKRFDDSGVLYVTETKKLKQFKRNINIALLELKKEKFLEKKSKGLLTNNEKKELAMITESGKDLVNVSQQKAFEGIYTYNNQTVSLADFEYKLKEIEKLQEEDLKFEKEFEKDKKISFKIKYARDLGEDTPHIYGIGKTPEEVNKYFIEKIPNWEATLKLSNFVDDKIPKDLKEKFENLVSILKNKGYLDIFFALDYLESRSNLYLFQEYIKDLPVSFNGDDFIYDS